MKQHAEITILFISITYKIKSEKAKTEYMQKLGLIYFAYFYLK